MNQSKQINQGANCSVPVAASGCHGSRSVWVHFTFHVRWLAGGLLVSTLAACGGSGMDADNARDAQGEATSQVSAVQDDEKWAQPGGEVPVIDRKTQTLMQEGAQLNTDELDRIAETGVMPKPFEGRLLSGADDAPAASMLGSAAMEKSGVEPKSAASRTAAYRFYNTRTGAHFFTTSTTERDNVRATLPFMTYEGPAFYASGTAIPGLSPVHRFYNTHTGVHFYTISEDERAHVVATLPQFTYEGIAYYASTLAGTGYTPLYRFFYAARGFHFYTNSEAEKDSIIASLPQYVYEGVGYYVLGNDWQTPAVPHTGITNGQCYQPGSNTLVDCATTAAWALNPDQDGRRTAINPMSYSQVISGYFGTFPTILPLYYPKTDCVRDDVTGLIWEGKTNTFSLHNGTLTFTNHGDGRSGDVSRLVSYANDNALCGFSDWRLPSVGELQSIVDHSPTSGPRIRLPDFPNTVEGFYWSSETYLGFANGTWLVGFRGTGDDATTRDMSAPARLVRGSAWSGTRYLVTSATYQSDSANNAVIDRRTGLTWRRCVEGLVWTGSACSGSAIAYNHVNALIRSKSIAGWRLPNIKELSSLADLSRQIPALDATAFPGLGGGVNTWSSTPAPGTADAGYVSFSNGYTGTYGRGASMGVLLVLANP